MLKRKYGSVMEFVLKKRLGWEMLIVAEGEPFERESDLRILWNDWRKFDILTLKPPKLLCFRSRILLRHKSVHMY